MQTANSIKVVTSPVIVSSNQKDSPCTLHMDFLPDHDACDPIMDFSVPGDNGSGIPHHGGFLRLNVSDRAPLRKDFFRFHKSQRRLMRSDARSLRRSPAALC